MADQIYKVLILLKRRPGMSVEEFREYYENNHRPLVAKYEAPGMCKYVRRFLDPLPHLDTKEVVEPEYDVITELWFDKKESFDGIMWMVREGQLPPDVLEDEQKLFDRPKTRYVLVTEHEG